MAGIESRQPPPFFGRQMVIGCAWSPYERGFKIDTEKPSHVVAVAIAQGLISQGSRVLDLGCGKNPRNAVHLAVGLDCQVDGIDRQQPELPQDPLVSAKLNLREGSVFDLEYPENTYQVVLLARLIQYLPPSDLETLMAKVHQTLAPSGFLLLSYTARGGVLSRGKAYDIHAFRHPITKVIDLLKTSGFKIKSKERGAPQSTNVPYQGEPATTYDIIAIKN